MKNKQVILGVLIGLVAMYALSSFVVQKRLSDLHTHLETKIEEQENIVKELALEIGRGDVSEKIEAVIKACPSAEATQYDILLSSLDKGLTKSDMQTLTVLFNRCGDIPASRRAGMTLLLEREVSFLNEMMQQRELLGYYNLDESTIADWKELVQKEQEISSLFLDLVDAQERIITALVLTGSPTGESIEAIQADATRIREKLSSISVEAAQLRTSLTSS